MDQKAFIDTLAKLRPSATFLSLIGYRNEHQEVADYSVVFHISYENALRRSLMALSSVVPEDTIQAKAKDELISSYSNSLAKLEETKVEDIDDAYTRFFDENGAYIKGVKVHTETSTLHLYGLVNAKRVVIPGKYPTRNKRELTIAKDKLRKMCPVEKFRQFKITPGQVDRIVVENLSLLPPA